MEAREKAIKAAEALNDRKARNLLILDVAGATIITEFMVICTAANAQHVNTLCDDVEDRLAEQGIALKKKEGQREGRWAILDYGDVLVHIFHPGLLLDHQSRWYRRLR